MHGIKIKSKIVCPQKRKKETQRHVKLAMSSRHLSGQSQLLAISRLKKVQMSGR
jgi:hypothetical protein